MLANASASLSQYDIEIHNNFSWCCMSTLPNLNRRFPSQVFESYSTILFEGCMLHIASDYDSLLKPSYGNYMELPPEEMRNPGHEPIKLDFGR
jgi:phosphorylcholine metabolism protein LicD